MQSGSDPEDIQTILSRFHTWAGKNPGNGKALASETDAVREIAYEEAMRNFRQRRKAPSRRVTAAEPSDAFLAAASAAPPEAASSRPEEPLPSPPPAALPPALAASPVQPNIEPAALARRVPAFVATTAPALPPKEKRVVRKRSASSPEPSSAQLPAVVPVQPRPGRVRQKASAPSTPKSRRPEPAKRSTALAVRPPVPRAKKPAFKKVLAKAVRGAQSSTPAARKTAPPSDRDRRITTRFSAAEQRRLERAAAQSGLTVSAWLRHCALLAERASAPLSAPAPIVQSARRALPAPPSEPTMFSTPAPSGLGNWLTLLRQRFLSSPARFSERA